MKTQFGELVTGDFEENTLTIEIDGEMVIQAGRYALVPIDDYNQLVKNCDLADVVWQSEQCSQCRNLPNGEVAISSKAITNPNWKE